MKKSTFREIDVEGLKGLLEAYIEDLRGALEEGIEDLKESLRRRTLRSRQVDKTLRVE